MKQTAVKILTAFAISGCATAPTPAPEANSFPLDQEFMVNKDGSQIVPCIVATNLDARGALFNQCATALQVPVREYVGSGIPNKMVFTAQPSQYFYNPDANSILFAFDQCDRIKNACGLTR